MTRTSDRERFGNLLAVCDTMVRLMKDIGQSMDRVIEKLEAYQEGLKSAIELHERTIERWNDEDEDEDTQEIEVTETRGDNRWADMAVDEAIEEARLRRAERKE